VFIHDIKCQAHSEKLIEQLEEAILVLLQELPTQRHLSQTKKQEKDRQKEHSRDVVLNIFKKCMLLSTFPLL